MVAVSIPKIAAHSPDSIRLFYVRSGTSRMVGLQSANGEKN